MALESDEIRVGQTGRIYVAPLNTAFPAGIGTAVAANAGWVDLGYTTEDGPQFSFGRETTDIMGWQSFDPLRTIVTSVPKTVGFTLRQTNQHVLKLAFGGGSVTEGDAGEYVYTPPDESEVDERALIVSFQDGDYSYRYCFRKASNKAGVDFSVVRTDAVSYAIEMSILAAGADVDPWFLQTDDPNVGELLEAAS